METKTGKAFWYRANRAQRWPTQAVYTGSVFTLGALASNLSLSSATAMPLFVTVASIAVIAGVYGRRTIIADLKRLYNQNMALKALHACELDTHKFSLSEFGAVCVLDARNRVIEANRSFQELVAATKPLTRVPLVQAFPELSHQPFWQALEAHDIWSGEIEINVGGTQPRVFFLATLPQFTADGQYMRTLLVLFDRTAEKSGAMDDLLHSTLEHLNEDVYVYDVETLKLRYMNLVARTRCGWSVQDVREKGITDTMDDFDLALFRKHSHPLVLGTQESTTIQVMLPRGPVEIVTRLINGIDNKRLFVSTLRDLSARQQIENARIQSVSMISHELRTPLTSIKGSLALLRSGSLGELSPQSAKVLDIAHRNSDRLITMVNDILDYVKLQSGKMSFADDRVDLKKLITESIENMQAFADGNSVRLNAHLPDEDAFGYGDSNRLMQVMVNLISNAVKFSPEGGEVVVGLSRVDTSWRLSITDQGPGIPASMVSKLGEPFTQFTEAPGKKHHGTGLGLTIVKKILKHHASRLGIATSDRGSEFSFDLPDIEHHHPAEAANQATRPTASEGLRYGN